MIETIIGLILGLGAFALLVFYNREYIKKIIKGVDIVSAVEIYEATVKFLSGGKDGEIDPEDAVIFVEELRAILHNSDEM